MRKGPKGTERGAESSSDSKLGGQERVPLRC